MPGGGDAAVTCLSCSRERQLCRASATCPVIVISSSCKLSQHLSPVLHTIFHSHLSLFWRSLVLAYLTVCDVKGGHRSALRRVSCRPPNDGRSSQDGSREHAITATNAASDASILVARSVKSASSSTSHVLTTEQQRDRA
jgi:hypothetical protein